MATLKWKRDLYERFKRTLPRELRDDAWFKIFYSDVRASTVAILGINPGGDPTDSASLLSASAFYENDAHDYVQFRQDSRYKIAGPMCTLLTESGIAEDLDSIRRIPKSNTLFHRSRKFQELVNPVVAEQLARPFVDEILAEINPRIVLFEGKTAFDWFAGPRWPGIRHRAEKPVSQTVLEQVDDFIGVQSGLLPDGKVALVIHHPSSWGARNAKPANSSLTHLQRMPEGMKKALRRFGLVRQ